MRFRSRRRGGFRRRRSGRSRFRGRARSRRSMGRRLLRIGYRM